MKPLITLFALLFHLTAFAVTPPPPDHDQQEQDQQEQDQQDQGDCRGRCTPHPRVFTCHVRMTDCYNRPLYTYWGRWTNPHAACQIALNLCMRDASMGYGGYNARCFVLGK